MHTKRQNSWPIALALVAVAVLLFVGGYALGLLRGLTPSDSPASSSHASSVEAAEDSSTIAANSYGVDASSSSDTLATSSEVGGYSAVSSISPVPSLAHVPDESGSYTSKDDVAAYVHAYGHLPSNFISKSKAKKAGWVSSQGNLDKVCPGMSIGGSEFYNYEGQLPDAPGRTWIECDINYEGGYRGAERIVFSNDGLVFYTGDHYESFEQLY